jgi:phage replication initiation protein
MTRGELPAAGAARAQRATSPTGACPPQLTGGYETQRAVVDWFSCTWLPESSDVHVARDLWDHLQAWIGVGVVGQECPGRYGFQFGCVFSFVLHGSLVPVGRCDWGGERRAGRARLDLSGSGCSRVDDWRAVRRWFESLEGGTITRVDLAVDFLLGEFGVQDALDWYAAGEFRVDDSGKQPRHSTPGDWHNPAYSTGEGRRWGRTLEVGRRDSGKMARIYEKGRQLGDSESEWVRFEVEQRNEQRELPAAMLTDCDAYFAGAYAICASLLDCAAERVMTHKAEGDIALARAVEFTRTSYGQVLNVLRIKLGADEALQLCSREGLPRRLQKSSLTAFNLIGADALRPSEISA